MSVYWPNPIYPVDLAMSLKSILAHGLTMILKHNIIFLQLRQQSSNVVCTCHLTRRGLTHTHSQPWRTIFGRSWGWHLETATLVTPVTQLNPTNMSKKNIILLKISECEEGVSLNHWTLSLIFGQYQYRFIDNIYIYIFSSNWIKLHAYYYTFLYMWNSRSSQSWWVPAFLFGPSRPQRPYDPRWPHVGWYDDEMSFIEQKTGWSSEAYCHHNQVICVDSEACQVQKEDDSSQELSNTHEKSPELLEILCIFSCLTSIKSLAQAELNTTEAHVAPQGPWAAGCLFLDKSLCDLGHRRK